MEEEKKVYNAYHYQSNDQRVQYFIRTSSIGKAHAKARELFGPGKSFHVVEVHNSHLSMLTEKDIITLE